MHSKTHTQWVWLLSAPQPESGVWVKILWASKGRENPKCHLLYMHVLESPFPFYFRGFLGSLKQSTFLRLKPWSAKMFLTLSWLQMTKMWLNQSPAAFYYMRIWGFPMSLLLCVSFSFMHHWRLNKFITEATSCVDVGHWCCCTCHATSLFLLFSPLWRGACTGSILSENVLWGVWIRPGLLPRGVESLSTHRAEPRFLHW